MADFPELPHVHHLAGEDDEHREQRFSRVVAMAIVLTTLAAATTAYLQAGALRDQDEANTSAARLATRALAARGLSDQAARLQIDRYDLAQEQRARSAAARQQAFFAPSSQQSALRLEQARWSMVAAQTENNTRAIAAAYGLAPVAPAAADGPERDRAFPAHYLAASRHESYRLGALREIANQEADRDGARIGRDAIALTLFAVAVFLFGYSLTPHARRRRRLYAGAASAFVTAGALWTLLTALTPPARVPDRAADLFADGRVAYDSEAFSAAVARLNDSLRLWPDSAQGHSLRALAEFAAGSPQIDVPLSLTTTAALTAATQDEGRAIELGAEDSGLVLQHGFDLFSLGLRRNDNSAIEAGLRYSEQASRARPTDPVPAYNIAVSLLALGRIPAAEKAYDVGVRRTVFSDRRQSVLRDDVLASENYLGEALTDLSTVESARPRLHTSVSAIKGRIIAPITRAAYAEPLRGQGPAVTLGKLSLDIGPAYTQVTLGATADVSRADLSTQWYFQAPAGLGWEVLSDISGATASSFQTDAHGRASQRLSFLGVSSHCLSPGRYRLEAYVNGRLAGRAEQVASFPNLVATRSRNLGVNLCRPAAWRPIAGREAGLLDGYSSPDGRSGTLIFSINRQLVGSAAPSPRLSRKAIDATLRLLRGQLPRGLEGGADAQQPFLGFAGELVRRYRYPGGAMLAGSGVSDSGQLLVALTYGPQQKFSSELEPVFLSLSTSQ